MRRIEKRDAGLLPGGEELPFKDAATAGTGIKFTPGGAVTPRIIMGSKSGARSAFEICKCLCVQSECDLPEECCGQALVCIEARH